MTPGTASQGESKAGKDRCPSSKPAGRQQELPFTRCFVAVVLIRSSVDWARPAHIRESDLLDTIH